MSGLAVMVCKKTMRQGSLRDKDHTRQDETRIIKDKDYTRRNKDQGEMETRIKTEQGSYKD